MKYRIITFLLCAAPYLAFSQNTMQLGISNKPKEGGGYYNSTNQSTQEEIEPQFEQKKNEDITAFHVYKGCRKYFENTFNTREHIARRAICNGYFFGFGSALLSLNVEGRNLNMCLPEDLNTEQIIQTFLDWTQENQSKLNNPASLSLITSLREKYSCDQKLSNLQKQN